MVNEFTAVSLGPPLVCVAVDRRSKACRYLQGRPFSVTALAARSHEAALYFADGAQAWPEPEWVDAGADPRPADGAASRAAGSPWPGTLDAVESAAGW